VAGENCTSACPYGLASMTKGDIYTIAGDGNAGFSGEHGPASEAELYDPDGLVVDGAGDLLVSDTGNNRVRLVASGAARAAAPVFTAASPPATALAGSHLEYTFSATGQPAPTYTLAPGAPSWLHIDPASGTLTGTVPSATTTFSFSVTATNSVASRTAGPIFTAAATPVSVSGTVDDPAGKPVAGAVVNACLSTGQPCFRASTEAVGAFTLSAVPGTTIVLTAYPPQSDSHVEAPVTSEPLLVPAAGLQGETIGLTALAPSNVSLTGSPGATTLDSGQPATAQTAGCPHGLAVVTVTAENQKTRTLESNIEMLSEDPAAPGTYSGTISPQYPLAGPAEITSSVSCPPQSTLVPSLGSANGGGTVIVTGAGFTGATGVDFGDVPAESYRELSEAVIEAVAPPGTGTVPVTVYGPGAPGGAGSVVVGQYTYVGVQSVSPASGPPAGGTLVTITGTGLEAATAVRFGKSGASFTQISSTELQTVSPPGEGSEDITVETEYGGTTAITPADEFTYSAADAGLVAPLAARGPAAGAQSHAARPQSARPPAARPHAARRQSARPPSARPQSARPQSHAARPQISYFEVDGVFEIVFEQGPEFLGQFEQVKDAIEVLTQKVNCEGFREVEEAAINLFIAPLVDAAADAALPWMEWLVTTTFSESGPLAPVIALAVTPVAVHWLANLIAKSLVKAAMDSVFGKCPQESESEQVERTASGLPDAAAHANSLGLSDLSRRLHPNASTSSGPGEQFHPNASTPSGPGEQFHPNAYIDPSGTILDTNGNPVAGATATILRSEAWEGPFVPVNSQAPGIQPAVNPQTTAADGVFHWEVDPGYYEVQAAAPGCTAAGEPGQSTATIGPYPVPPPQLGLTISLSCPDEPPAPVPSVTSLSASTGPGSGGTTVTVLGSGFTPSSRVLFGTAAAQTVTYFGPQALQAVSPPGAGPVDVVVQSAHATSATSAADQFFYGSAPTVSGLSLHAGPAAGATRITVFGTGFTGAYVVGFGGLPGGSLVVKSDSELEVTSPPEPARMVDIQVVTPAGTSAEGPADQYTYLPAATPSGGGAGLGPITGAPAAEPGATGAATTTSPVRPVVSGLSQASARWLEARKRGARSKLPVGTTFRFTLNEPATVHIQLSQSATGRKVGKRCVVPASQHDHRRGSCTAIRVLGTLTLNGLAGVNTVKFAGTLPGHRRLAPGRYELQLTATAAGETSSAATLTFTIAGPS
jgi:IPT/TIG domain/Putative Ig domain